MRTPKAPPTDGGLRFSLATTCAKDKLAASNLGQSSVLGAGETCKPVCVVIFADRHRANARQVHKG